jgi:hypothetical protein
VDSGFAVDRARTPNTFGNSGRFGIIYRLIPASSYTAPAS